MTKEEALVPATAEVPLDRQRLFVRYFTGILIDLVVLNLFAEYAKNPVIDTFTTSLLAAVVLQALLQLTIAIEHRVGNYFKAKPGGLNKFLRIFCAWLVLFGSKFVILEALSFAFGDNVQFHGMFHGLVALIVVVVAMLVVEEVVVRIYRRLGRRT
jgi:heme A synthase